MRKPEVRAAFPDGIGWLELSQKPDVLGLQRRLYFQLLKERMPKTSEGSLSEQHTALADALTGRTMLLAIDGRDYPFNKLHFLLVNLLQIVGI